MALDPLNAPGIDNTDPAKYPKGSILNNQTVVGSELYGDILQFFVSIMEDAGLTFNGLKDNITNNYQYLEAVKKSIHKPPQTTSIIIRSGLENPPAPIAYAKFAKTGSIVHLESKFNCVESSSSSSSVIEFSDISIPTGNIGQRLNAFMDGSEIQAAVSKLSPLQVTIDYPSVAGVIVALEVFGTLLGAEII